MNYDLDDPANGATYLIFVMFLVSETVSSRAAANPAAIESALDAIEGKPPITLLLDSVFVE